MSSDGDITTSRLPEAVQEKAREELGERLECRQEDIQKLRDIVNSELNFPHEDSDAFLLRFLRARKFNHHKAAKLIHRYYEVRVEHSKFYHQYKPSSLGDFYEKGTYVMLPVLKDTDPQPILARQGHQWDPEEFPLEWVWKGNMMQAEKLLRTDERTQVNGFVIITDMADMSWRRLKCMTLKDGRFLATVLQNALPCRIKGMHFVNTPRYFEYLFSLAKPFMSRKLRSRMHVHSSPDYLKKHFDLSVLPQSLGGTLDIKPLISKWVQVMADSEEEFVALEKYGMKKVEAESHTTKSYSGFSGYLAKLSWS